MAKHYDSIVTIPFTVLHENPEKATPEEHLEGFLRLLEHLKVDGLITGDNIELRTGGIFQDTIKKTYIKH